MRIAVTGAGGTVGGRVVDLLAAEPGHEVVGLARGELRSSVAPTVVADYADVGALRAALSGVDTLVFVSSDGEAAKVLVHHENVVRAAAESGVPHVVALSGLDADVRSPFCYAFTYGRTEEALRASGCGLSIARASIFAEFFLRWLRPARGTGQIRVPAGDGRISLVSQADVARCLAALALRGPDGIAHAVTGPEALGLGEVAAHCAVAWGRRVEYVDLDPHGHAVEMAAAGEDPWWAYAFATMFASVREQRWAEVSDAVTRLTGRPPVALDALLSRTRPEAP
jgi:NAD(P)H dehydrogenase (quinone)